MTVPSTVQQALESARIPYEVLSHPPAFTAQEVAAAQHVSGRRVAKVVIVKADLRLVMALLPATERLDLHKLTEATGARHCRLASEAEFAERFPGCDVGAMPPFGHLYGMPVYADRQLADTVVVFQAGSHAETIRMRWADLVRLTHPIMTDLVLVHEDV